MRWRLHKGRKAKLTAQADIAVLTSVKEGIPRALMQASAVGVPIVATDVKGRREVEYRAAEPCVPERQLFALVDPAQIDVARLILDATAQAIRQRRGDRPVEVPTRRVPRDRAARERDQHPVWLARRQECFDLARDPGGGSRGWRGEEQQVFGVVECPCDGAPERGVGGKACLVPENAERVRLVPGPREALQCFLDRFREVQVFRVAIGNERVVLLCNRPSIVRTRVRRHRRGWYHRELRRVP
jgi:hypothetical protein